MLRLYKKNERHERPTGLASPPLWRLGFLAIAMLLFMLPTKSVLAQVTISGSATTYTTIQLAIDAAVTNDVINVAAGTYTENININKQLDIRGANYNVNPNDASWNPNASRVPESIIVGTVSWTGQAYSLNGFSLKANVNNSKMISLLGGTTGTITIANNIMSGESLATNALWVGTSMTLNVTNNTFKNFNKGSGNFAIMLDGEPVGTYSGNYFVNNTNNGMIVQGSVAAHQTISGNNFNQQATGIILGSGGHTIDNNLFTNQSLGRGVYSEGGNNTITNNTFTNNNYALWVNAGSGDQVHNNSFLGGDGAGKSIYYYPTASTLDASCNWWNTPLSANIPAKFSGASSTPGMVNFVPFSTAASPMNCLGLDTVYLAKTEYTTPITKEYDGNVSLTTTLGAASLTTAPAGVTLDASAAAYAYVDGNVNNAIAILRTGFTLGGANAANYILKDTVTTVTGAITAKAVTVTASDQNKCFGTAFVNGQSTTNFTDTGFVGTEGLTSVELNVPALGAAANAVAGNYPITASNAMPNVNTNLSNYTVTYVNGTLTAQPILRAYVAGVANENICAGTGVSLNYALYGPGILEAKLQISQIFGGSTVVPLDTFVISGATAATNLSVVLPDSLTPNSGGNDFITYRLKWVSIESDIIDCIGITDGQVDVNVYPVPTINVALADSTVCSGTPVSFTLTNPNFVTGASYKVTANYGPSGSITGGTIPGTGLEYLFTIPNFTETLVNTTNAPVIVTYTFITKNNNPNKACQGGYITRTVVINPTPTVGTLAFAQVCDGGSTSMTVTGLLPSSPSKIDYSITQGASTTTSSYTSTSDALGNVVLPSMVATMANNGTVYEITMVTDTATGCSKSFTGKTTTLVVDTLPVATYTFNTTPHVSGDIVGVCIGSYNTLVASNATTGDYTAGLYKDGTQLVANQAIASNGSYTWNFGPTDLLDAGKYWVLLTNTVTGCTHADTLHVIVNPLPALTYTFNSNTQVDGDTVAVCTGSFNTLVGSNTTSDNYSVSMYHDGIQMGSSQTIAASGSYTLPFGPTDALDAGQYSFVLTNTVTGCTHSDTLNVIVNPLPTAVFTVNAVAMVNGGTAEACFGSTVNLTLTNTAFAASYSLSHYDGVTTTLVGSGSLASPLAYSFNAAVSDAGAYYLTLTSDSGCVTMDTFNLIVNPLPVLTYTFNGNPQVSGATVAVCIGSFNTLVGSNGTSDNYSVSMYHNGIQMGSSQTIAASGSYTLPFGPTDLLDAGQYWIVLTNTVTGCTHTDTLNINVNPLPALTYTFNSNIQVNGDTVAVCTGSFNTLVGLNGTTDNYSVSMYHDGIQMGSSQTIAANGSYTLPFGPTDALDAGQYSFVLTNTATGCTHSDTLNVIVNPLPSAVFTINTVTKNNGDSAHVCFGSTVDLTLTNTTFAASYSLVHYDGVTTTTVGFGNLASPLAYSFTAANSDAGYYYLTLTSDSGCSTVDTFHLIVNPLPTATYTFNNTSYVSGATVEVCVGSYNTLVASNGTTDNYTASLFFGGTQLGSTEALNASGSHTWTFGPTDMGDDGKYWMLLTNTVTGCTHADTLNVIVNPLPVATYTFNSTSYVSGATVEVCVGSYNTLVASNGTADNYTASLFFGVTQLGSTEALNASGSHTWTFGPTDMGDDGKYWMLLTNTVTGCTHADTLNVIVNPLPVATYTFNSTGYVNGDSVQVCSGSTNTLIASNGTTDNYTASLFFEGTQLGSTEALNASGSHTWTFGPADMNDNGKYWMLLTNTVTGCTHADTLNVKVNPLPVFVVSTNGLPLMDSVTYCQDNNILVELTGDAGFTYVVTKNGSSFASGTLSASPESLISGLATASKAGTYVVTVTNNVTGCDSTSTFKVKVNQKPSVVYGNSFFGTPSAFLSITNVLCYGDNSGKIVYKVTGNAPTFPLNIKIKDVTHDTIIYILNNVNLASYTATQSSLTAGDYQVIVSNNFGCADTLDVTITQPLAPLTLSVTHDNASCGGATDGKLTFGITGGTTNYALTVTGPNTNYNANFGAAFSGMFISNLGAGVYTFNLVDGNGCTKTITHTIYQPTSVATTATVTGPATVYTGATADVTFSAPGLVAPVTFYYTVNGAPQTAVATTGNSVAVAIPTTSITNYTYIIDSVKDANGTPCSLTIGGSLVVDVVDGAVPDLTPIAQLGFYSLDSLNSSTTFDIILLNVGSLSTSGTIEVIVVKPAGVSFDFTGNPAWTVANLGANVYKLTSTSTVIAGNAIHVISGTVQLNPTYQSGSGDVTISIVNNSGGETNNLNNTQGFKINLAH